MKYREWLLSAGLITALTGCGQAQLDGPLGGANVTIETVGTGAVLSTASLTSTPESVGAEVGGDVFAARGPRARLLALGIVDIGAAVDPDTWYLVTVSDGFEYDADRDGVPDGTPTQVFGAVHALVRGSAIEPPTYSVTPVTEALYQYLKPHLSGLDANGIQTALDAAAAELVGDIDGSGTADYADTFLWTPLYTRDRVIGDLAVIDAIAAGIRAGESEAMITQLALQLFADPLPEGVSENTPAPEPEPEPEPDPEEVYTITISNIVQGRCGSCHRIGGVGSRGSSYDLQPTSNSNHVAENVAMFTNLVNRRGVDYIIEKSSGIRSHGGGNRWIGQDAQRAEFEAWLRTL